MKKFLWFLFFLDRCQGISDEGLSDLTEDLGSFEDLQKIYLLFIRFGEKGEIIKEFRCVGITDKGMERLGDNLKHGKSLKEIHVCFAK